MKYSNIIDELIQAFIHPIKSNYVIYLTSFFGTLGCNALMVYFAFKMTGESPVAIIGLLSAKFIFSNLLYLPILFLLIKYCHELKIFILLFIIQIITLIIFINLNNSFEISSLNDAILIGILISIITEPFWAIFHSLMLVTTSDANRAHEVALVELSICLGTVLGAMIGGILLYYIPGNSVIVISASTLIITSIILTFKLLAYLGIQKFSPELLSFHIKNLISKPSLIFITMVNGGLESLSTFLAPVWMKILGFSAITTGTLIGFQVLGRFLISPITGYLYKKNKAHEISVGSIFYIISWIPWLLSHSVGVYIWSSINWTLGSHMTNVGLSSRWYSARSLEGMAVREICLGLGRLFCVFTLIPLLYISKVLFFAGAIGLALILLITSKIINR